MTLVVSVAVSVTMSVLVTWWIDHRANAADLRSLRAEANRHALAINALTNRLAEVGILANDLEEDVAVVTAAVASLDDRVTIVHHDVGQVAALGTRLASVVKAA